MEYSLWSWAQSSFHLLTPGSLGACWDCSTSACHQQPSSTLSPMSTGAKIKWGAGHRRHPKLRKQKFLSPQEPGGCAYSELATKAPVSHSSVECFRCKAISIMTDDNMASCTHQNLDGQILGPSGCWSGCWLPSTHSSH